MAGVENAHHVLTTTDISAAQFATLLRHLGAVEVLVQSVDGTLLLGRVGERVVNHYSFYAAFATPEEWRLVSAGQALGTLPIEFPLTPGLFLIFAGRRWRVVAVDTEHKVVDLTPAPGGRPPRWHGPLAPVHARVREELLAVYQTSSFPAYLDARAAELLTEARQNFARYRLDERRLVQDGEDTYMFLWAGDRIVNTVMALLSATKLAVTRDGLALSVAKISPVELAAHLVAILAAAMPEAVGLAAVVRNKVTEKFDAFLPDELLDVSYAARSLDVPGAWRALRRVVESTIVLDPGER